MPLARPRVWTLLLCALTVRLCAEPVLVHPPRDPATALSLAGTWQFAYQAGPAPSTPPAAFAPITVPGHWELQGFAEPRYGRDLAAGTGYYQRTLRLPAGWQGQRIMLRFDGVLSGFDVRIDDQPVGSWTSGYNPATFDITDHVRPETDHRLTVTVTTRSHGWEFDTNDCWSLSGIYRDVTVFAVPAAHLQHFSAETTLAPDGSATLTVRTQTSGPTAVQGRLLAPDGQLAAELRFVSGDTGAAAARVTLARPQLWTAESPALYTLELTLASGQILRERIGLRQITIVDGVLLLNGRPIKLRGLNHHDLWPDSGRVADEAALRRDLELFRAANCNFLRTAHYPPHPRLLELCDELGLYVMDEVPFGFGEEHLADERYRATLLERAAATVRRDQHHASVILWSVGNENQNTPLTFAAAAEVQRLDPTRPVCFPQIGSYFAKTHPELPGNIGVYAPHYPSTATVRDYAGRLARPVIFTEYAHALGLATDQIQAQWAIIQASPRLAGGAVWMFQDQGIRRTARPGETPARSHALGLNVWPDATSYYDTAGNLGMDGVVYSDRVPQTDFWQLRKVYSPVQIAGRSLALSASPEPFTLTVENRFDFRSLAGCRLDWRLRADDRVLATGTQPLQAAARSSESITLPAAPAAAATAIVAWLELTCRDETGRVLTERSLRLRPTLAARPAWAGGTSGPLALTESPTQFTLTHPAFRLEMDRVTGSTTLRSPDGRLLAEGFQPHAGRRLTEGEFVRREKERTWPGGPLAPAPGFTTSATTTTDGIALRLQGRFPRPDAPDQALVGETTLLARPDGRIEVSYAYQPADARGLLLEAGLSLLTAPGLTEFRWAGEGPYAGYPGKDALGEFGLHRLNREDLYFGGNRRSTECALVAATDGAGVLLLPDAPADIAVETSGTGLRLAHNAVLSGRGTKFVTPDTAVWAESTPAIAGRFTLQPLAQIWPETITRLFGPPGPTPAYQPYFHSYDR